MAFKAWRFVSREAAKVKKQADLKRALRETNDAFQSVRERGAGVRRSAMEIAGQADDEFASYVKSGAKKTLEALDAPRKYVGAPAAAVLTGQLTEERKMGADGQYYRDAPEFMEGPRSWKRALTQNPVDTYKEARQASEERYRDPALQKDIVGRVALSTASDPLSVIPSGTAARVLPRGLAATRGARVAAEVVETPRRVIAGGAAGAAAGEYLADKAGAPAWVGQVAGGIAGGGIAARRPGVRGVSASRMVDVEHPQADAYMQAMARNGVDFAIDEHGILVPDMDALDAAIGRLGSQADASMEARGIYDRSQSPYVEVGGKQVRRSKKRIGTIPAGTDPDFDAIADWERLREIAGDEIPVPERETMRMERLREENKPPEPAPLTERQKKLRETRAAKEAAAKAEQERIASLPYRAPKMQKDGAYTIVYKTDRTAERFYTAGKRGAGGLAKAKALYEAEDAKYADLVKAETPAPKLPPAREETVKRTDLFGNVTDTRQTETELNGWKPEPEYSEQGRMRMPGTDTVPAGQAHFLDAPASISDEVRQPTTTRTAGEPAPGVRITGSTYNPGSGPGVKGEAWYADHPRKQPVSRAEASALAKSATTLDELEDAITETAHSYHPWMTLPSDTLMNDWRGLRKAMIRRANDLYLKAAVEAEGADSIKELDAQLQRELRSYARRDATAMFKDIERAVLGEELWPDILPDKFKGAGGNLDREMGGVAEPRLDPSTAPGEPGAPPPEGIGPGNAQPQLGQTEFGADLLQLPNRERAIAGEAAFMASRAGKVDTKLRESTARLLAPVLERGGAPGRAANITRDERITPIWKGINQAENQRAHLKALIDDKLHALVGSGLRIEQAPDGNWVEANSGIPWSDVVEQDGDAARAAWNALTDDQRRLTTELTDLQKRATETVQRYGGDQSLLEHEGEHWPRRVASIAGEEKARGMMSSKRVGAERSVNKSRTVGTAAEGADRQIVYEHPFDAYTTAFDDKMKNATDAWVESMVKPLAKQGAGSFATLNAPGQPGLAGMNFDPADANRINAGLAGDQHGVIEGGLRGLNSVLTPIRASLDFSATFQQGMKLWVTDPKAAAKHWKTALASLKNEDVYYQSRSAIDAEIGQMLTDAGIQNQGGIEFLITNGLRQTAEGAEHEFALPRISGKLERAAKPYNKVAEKSQQHFDRLLNLYRLEASRDVVKRMVDEGKRGDELATELRRGTKAINRAFGWSESKPTSIEAIGMFAPRFFRSNIESIYKAFTDKGIEGQLARDHLGRMAAIGVALTVATNEARGYETEFRPWESNFMKIRNVGGVDVSVYGPYDTLIRYTAAALTGDPGSVAKLAQSKSSPAVGTLIAQLQGKTYMGEPLDSKTKRVTETLKNLTPFPVQNVIEQGIEEGSPKDALVSGVVGAFGLKNNPLTPSERVKFLQSGHRGLTGLRNVAGEAQNRFGMPYDELTGAQKAVVNETPKIARALDDVTRRASKGDTDRAARARIQQTARDEIDASAKYLAAGVDDAGKRYTGNDFRLAYNDTQMRAAGAYKQLGRDANDAVGRWFALYDEATLANGQPDYDKLERLQAEFRAKNPGIDEEVAKITGIRDNAATRELREARKEASAYYAIPRYRGLSLEEGDQASEVLTIASDMVRYGQARNRGHAFRLLREQGMTDAVRLAQRALRRGANPEREKFRKSSPLFAKYYSEASAASAAA